MERSFEVIDEQSKVYTNCNLFLYNKIFKMAYFIFGNPTIYV